MPAAFVPMKLPITLLSWALVVSNEIERRRLYIDNPRITLSAELTKIASRFGLGAEVIWIMSVALSITGSVFGLAPGWL